MSLDLAWIAGLTLAFAALAAALAMALVPALSRSLAPTPRVSRLSDQLPFERVLTDNVTLKSKDGALTQTLWVQGVDTSIKTAGELSALLNSQQRWLDDLSAVGASFKILTVRTELSKTFPSGAVNPMLADIHDRWMSNFERLYANRHFIVLTLTPERASGIRGFFGHREQQACLGKLNELTASTLETLHPFQAGCLCNYLNAEGVSPLLSFWAELVNGAPCPIRPHPNELSERLAATAVQFSDGVIEYDNGSAQQFCKILSLNTWAEFPSKELLPDIQSLPGKLIILQLCQGMNKFKASSFLEYQKMQNELIPFLRSQAVREEYRQAMELVSSQAASLYQYQLSVFLLGDTREQVERLLSQARTLFKQYGFAPITERVAIEPLWFSQFPGIDHFVRTTHPMSRDLKSLISFDREPTGLSRCCWGEGPIRFFKTPAGGAYAFQFHISEQPEAVAHSLVIAPTGAGKTTLFQHLIGGALRHSNLRAYLFDRLNGTRIFTQAIHGSYIDLSDDGALMNPLVCEDTPQNRAFLQQFLLSLAECEDAQSHAIIARAVRIIFQIPQEQRVFKHLFASLLDINTPVRAGLEKWASDAYFSRWFNGVKRLAQNESIAFDALSFSNHLVSFEMTEVQANPQVAAAVTTYLMHKIRTLAQKEASPHLIFIDEAQPMLMDATFAKNVDTLLKEHRKLRGAVALCFQRADGVNATMLEQCKTRFLFPNPSANREEYAKFELTDSEWEYIKGTSRAAKALKHSVLVKRSDNHDAQSAESVILDCDLSVLGPLIHLYRSGTKPVKLVRELQQQWGMQQWVEQYLRLLAPPY